jgi:hypothetical protein
VEARHPFRGRTEEGGCSARLVRQESA